MPEYWRVAGGFGPGQQHRPGPGDLGEEGVGVEGPVQQHQHPRFQQLQQPPGQRRLVSIPGRGPQRGIEQPRVPVSANVISRTVG